MAADQVLVNHSQVEVVAEGVNMHQVPHLIALLSEEHRQLKQGGTQSLPAQNGMRFCNSKLKPGHFHYTDHSGKWIERGRHSLLSVVICGIIHWWTCFAFEGLRPAVPAAPSFDCFVRCTLRPCCSVTSIAPWWEPFVSNFDINQIHNGILFN